MWALTTINCLDFDLVRQVKLSRTIWKHDILIMRSYKEVIKTTDSTNETINCSTRVNSVSKQYEVSRQLLPNLTRVFSGDRNRHETKKVVSGRCLSGQLISRSWRQVRVCVCAWVLNNTAVLALLAGINGSDKLFIWRRRRRAFRLKVIVSPTFSTFCVISAVKCGFRTFTLEC